MKRIWLYFKLKRQWHKNQAARLYEACYATGHGVSGGNPTWIAIKDTAYWIVTGKSWRNPPNDKLTGGEPHK